MGRPDATKGQVLVGTHPLLSSLALPLERLRREVSLPQPRHAQPLRRECFNIPRLE